MNLLNRFASWATMEIPPWERENYPEGIGNTDMAAQGLSDYGYGHTGAVGFRVCPHKGCWIKGMATQGLWD